MGGDHEISPLLNGGIAKSRTLFIGGGITKFLVHPLPKLMDALPNGFRKPKKILTESKVLSKILQFVLYWIRFELLSDYDFMFFMEMFFFQFWEHTAFNSTFK